MADENNKHLVFVYGSLKTGFCNHHVLEDSDSTFLGEAKTADESFLMASYGAYPAVFRTKANQGFSIAGEIFEVDNKGLERLDRLESNGRFYQREQIDIVLDDDDDDGGFDEPVVQAWMYLLLYQPPRCWDGIVQTEDDVLIWVR